MRLFALSAILTLTLASPAAAGIGDCGQPRSDGDAPTIGDVLHILGAALHHRDCPAAICDVDDDCRVTVRDALETLRHVIGKDGENLRCGDDCSPESRRCGESEAPTCGGVCPDDYECTYAKLEIKVPVCHIPPGNEDEKHTIWIGKSAVRAHLDHGDYFGRCRDDDCRRDRDDDDDDDDDEDDCRWGDRDDDDRDGEDMTFSGEDSSWWWHPTPRYDCRCKLRDDVTTTSTTTSSTTTSSSSTSSSSTTSSTTTTTLPSGDDTDNDGLANVDDPCPTSARNLCVGPVAVDGTTSNEIRLNAGVDGGVTCGARIDCNGDEWNADFGYNQVEDSTTCDGAGGCPISGVEALFGCTDEATQDLFRCEHWDPAPAPELSYSFDVPDGTYVVNLFFANTYGPTAAPGARTMDLLVEGEVVYPAFDQVAAAGGSTQAAVVRAVVVAVADGNGLQIAFGHGIENPTVKAIEVLEVVTP
jgi:hypothetical protein